LNLEAHRNKAFNTGANDMNSRFKQTLLRQILSHLTHNQEKGGLRGFTLIELLVVIIIVGVLSAIALPSFLNQTTKARQAEAKSYIGALNKGQHAYYSEKLIFTDDINRLGIGLSSNTQNYLYIAEGAPALLTTRITNKAISRKIAVKSYVGVIAMIPTTNESFIKYMICNSNNPNHIVGGTPIPNGDIVADEPICPTPGFSVDE
jgi:prepilin-type N-terminal cleavage/methylation domain-containing protein